MSNEQHGGRGEKSAEKSNQPKEASSGGRGEQNVQQRNEEQAKAGNDKQARPPVHNVKSEPHWDPTEAPSERDAPGTKAGS